MKKQNLFLRLAAVLMVAALFAGCILSGTTTLAKYTSTASGTAKAQVAKWSIDISGTDIAASAVTNLNIDLFGTLLEDDVSTSESHVVKNIALSADVTAGNGRVAPGTGGTFAGLVITNKSEVYAEYTVTISSITAGSIPLEFSFDGGTTWVKPAAVSSESLVLDNSGGGYAPNDATAVADMGDIQWRWAFDEYGTGTAGLASESSDVADTTLGKVGTAEATVTISITATQMD